MDQSPDDPMTAYMRRTADFLRAQAEDDGTPEAEARIDAITDDLDILWYKMTPAQSSTISARIAARADAIFIPRPTPPSG